MTERERELWKKVKFMIDGMVVMDYFRTSHDASPDLDNSVRWMAEEFERCEYERQAKEAKEAKKRQYDCGRKEV